MRVIENKKATEIQELDRFGLSARYNTLLCGLLDCIGYRMILHVFEEGHCPPYIVRDQDYKSVRFKR